MRGTVDIIANQSFSGNGGIFQQVIKGFVEVGYITLSSFIRAMEILCGGNSAN